MIKNKGKLHLLLIPIALLLLWGCSPYQKIQETERKNPYLVRLAPESRARRVAILLKDMGLDVAYVPLGPLPYSSNASASIWIGSDVPPETVAAVVDVARHYFEDLRYIAFSNSIYEPPTGHRDEIYIGAPTDRALKLGLKAWKEEDFNRLKTVKSSEELHTLVESKYPARFPLRYKIKESPFQLPSIFKSDE